MYYIANTIIYKMGFKIGSQISHKVASDTLIHIVRPKLKETLIESFENSQKQALSLMDSEKLDDIILSLDMERKKRSDFQYEIGIDIKKSKSETSFTRAKVFQFEMNKLLLD
jgi:hypothetical protein